MANLNKKAFEAIDKSLASRRHSLESLSSDASVSSNYIREEAAVLQNNIKLLKLLLVESLKGLESLSETQTPNVELGIDFYDAVSRFEIELIKRALKLMNGHQRKAARLLNMNASTLGAKIKHYQIQLGHPAFFKNL